ncbi:hypothetical protein BASA81_000958 [Batrachochytrium salamandrivorans]|nr:hypothetical protein BASA81_012150 [Batrachochytrium salamandrivorans]KAH9261254.1 hypothetical protein BASA81_000958 [Batrachochytrium salamandrivorans]
MLLIALLAFSHVAMAAVTTSAPTVSMETKQYSYICLQANQNLCLGISPGDGLPFYDPNSIFKLQIKQRLRNEDAGTDYKKTRWDVDYVNKTVSLSWFTHMCMANPINSDYVGLYPCDQVHNGTFAGTYQLAFNQNIQEMAEIKSDGDPTMCMTVMACNPDRNGYCNWFSNIMSNTFTAGSIVRMKKCWFAPGGDPGSKPAQTFLQALDCAPGCSPMLQNNNVCDPACANAACNLDNGLCLTAAPTMPTRVPTKSPTTSRPSTSPTPLPTRSPTIATTQGPTRQPTYKPSKSPVIAATEEPTLAPTLLPTTSPTSMPTASPFRRPTTSPTSSAPTVSPITSAPTDSPITSTPSAAPSSSPTVDPVLARIRQKEEEDRQQLMLVIGVCVPLILLFLCCFVMYCVARDRRRRFEKRPKQWGSMIDVNQAAYKEYFKEHSQPQRSFWQRYVCCCGGARRRASSSSLGCCLAPLAPSSSKPSAFSSHYPENQSVAAYNPPQQYGKGGHVAMINPAKPSNNKPLPIVLASTAKTHGKHTGRPIQQQTTTVVAYTESNDGYLI